MVDWRCLGMTCIVLLIGGCKSTPPPVKVPPTMTAPQPTTPPATATVVPPAPALPAATTPMPDPPSTAPTIPGQTSIPLPASAPHAHLTNSERHRRLFNEVAQEYFDFRWVRDESNPHVVDVPAGELVLPEAMRNQYGLPAVGWEMTPRLSQAITFVETELERRRVAAVQETLSTQQPTHFAFDMRKLSPPYQQAARQLIEAGYYIQELYKRQMLRPDDDQRSAVFDRAIAADLALLRRNLVPICGRYSSGPFCDLLPIFLAPRVGETMWPEGLTDEQFAALKAAGADAANTALLSPFTVVRMNDGGAYTWTPYAKHPEFQSGMEAIAKILEDTAAIEGLEEGFKRQLVAQAQAFRSEEAYPYFQSDQAWGVARGELELTIGPYETYRDPRQLKAFFDFVLGMEDPEATALVQKFKPLMQSLENGFAALIGAGYAARTLDVDAAPIRPLAELAAPGAPEARIRVIETILATGDENADGGPWSAYHLPNIGPMTDAGKGKRVIMKNHIRAKFPITQSIARIALIDEQQNDVDPQALLYNITFHEIAHGLGPRENAEVAATDGKKTPINLLLGEYAHALEEAKADVAGLWSVKALVDAKILTADEARRCYITYVAGLFKTVRYGLEEAHGRGAAMELSYLIEKGAVEARGDRYAVNLVKIPEAIAQLLAEIGKVQASGNVSGAKALLESYPKKAPMSVKAIIERVEKAGIPREIAAYYHTDDS